MDKQPNRPQLYAGLAALALAGLAAQLYATVWGGGISPDSTQYVLGARSLLRGEGISAPDGDGVPQPITLWPPLLPLLLAAPGVFGVDPAEAGRWLNALLFAGNILLVGHVVAQSTRHSVGTAWAGAALILLSPDLFEVHTWVWSEPLFILLSLAACALLAAFLERPTRRRLWVSAAAAGLAGLTRFAGAALGLAGILAILGFGRVTSFRRRAVAATGYGIGALAPLALWMVRNLTIAGSATTRQLGFRRLYSVHFLPGLETAAGWLFPGGPYSAVRAGLLGLFLAGLLWACIRYLKRMRSGDVSGPPLRLLPHTLVAFLVCYGGVLLFSKFFVDPLFPLDDRILSPALAALILLLAHLAHAELARPVAPQVSAVTGLEPAPSEAQPGQAGRGRRALTGLFALLLAAQLGLSGRQSAAWAATGHEKGLGYSSRSWQQSTLVAFVEALPAEASVLSNAEDGLLFSTGHPAWRLPPASAGDWVEQIRQRLSRPQAYVVYFDAITWRDLVTPDDLQQQFTVQPVLQADEGVVLQISPRNEE